MDMMSYLMGRNSSGAKKGAKIEVVTELPETGEANVIYLVPKETEDENNIFDEYLYINDEWELIGTTDIDLSGYQPLLTAGDNITINNNVISSSVKQYIFDNSDTQENKLKVLNDFYHSYKKGEANALAVKKQISNYPKMVLMSPSYVTPTRMEFGESYTSFPSSSTDTYGIKYKYFLYVNLTLIIDETNDVVTNFNISNNTLGFFPDNINYLLGTTNTNAYTPTGDYNPATKKYVDDAVSGAGSDIIVFQDPERYNNTVSSMNNIEQNKTNLKRLADALKDGKSPLVYFDKVVMGSSGALITSPYRYLSMYRANYDETSDTYSFNFYTLYPTGFTDSYAYKYDTQYINSLSYVYTAQSGTTQKFNSKQTYGGLLIAGSSEISRYPISSLYFNWALGLERYSSSKTYQIGDYIVSYNSSAQMSSQMCTIYKCNTADTTGSWDSSKWDEKTYMEYLSDKLVGGALNGSY